MTERANQGGRRVARRIGGASFLAGLLLLPLCQTSSADMAVLSETAWGGTESEISESAAVAPDGSTYVAGTTFSFGTTPPSIFLGKYAADGSLAWQRVWDGPGIFGSDQATGVAVAPDGSVYVTGATLGDGGDAVLLRFSADGTLLWQRGWGGAANDRGEDVAVGADGSVYVTGSTASFGVGESSLFVVKFDPAGSLAWQKVWGPGSPAEGQGIAVAADGSVYAAGVTPRADFSGFDAVVLKLDAAGASVWQRTFAAGDVADARGGVTVGADGSVYVAGGVQEPARTIVDLDALLLRITPEGDLAWARTWGGRSGDEAVDVATAPDGTVLLAGNTNSHGLGSDDAFLLQVLPSGKVQDASTWGAAALEHSGGVGAGPDGTISLAATAQGGPYSLLRAPAKLSRVRGGLTAVSQPVADVAGTVSDPAGVVVTPDATQTAGGGFDAVLVRLAP